MMRYVSSLSMLLSAGLLLSTGCSKVETGSNSAAKDSPAIQRVSEKGPVKLTVRITPPEPRLSDLVEMNVEVTAESGVDIKPPAFGEAVGDFLVRDYSERSPQPTSANEATSTRIFHYQLEPVHTGTHLIRSVAVEFVDHRESSESKGKAAMIESEPIEIKVTSELGDQVPDLANLEPMRPPLPIESSSRWWWLAPILLAVAVAVLFVWRRRTHRERVILPPSKTPAEIAQAALAQLLSENLPSQGLLKEFYVRLTGIVRVFIEGTTGLHAPEQTTEEFLDAMRNASVIPAERSSRLKEFLEAADMVKYAGQQPSDDQIDTSIQRAREFIDR